MTFLKIALPVASLISSIALAPIAQAQDTQTVFHAVRYGDLDLSTTSGRNVLRSRIHHAAVIACSTATPAEMLTDPSVSGCVTKAEDAAMAKASTAEEAALHRIQATVIAFN